MKSYASGIQASELRLVDEPADPVDAPSVAGSASPQLSLVGASAPSGSAPATSNNRAPALSLVDAPAAPAKAPGVTNKPSPELGLIELPAAPGGAPDVTKGPARDLGPVEVIEVHEPGYRAPPTTSRGAAARGAGQEQHPKRSAPHPHALRVSVAAGPGKEAPGQRTSKQTGQRPGGTARGNRKMATWVAGVLGSLVVVAGFVAVAMRSESAPAQQFNVAKPAPPAVVSAPSTPSAEATAQDVDARSTLHDHRPMDDFAGKIPALKRAGNWNVLVIYAGEWTRAQPANADAWRELSMGYVKLRQLRDAFDAATKAVEVAPRSFLAWQNLGRVNVALQDPAAALAAFERATALNDQDVVSLVQAAMLDTRLGRLVEARTAFAKALALSPEDVDALCGATSLAQKEGRLQDAEATAQRLKSIDGICRDSTAGESVRLAAPSGSAKNAIASSTGR
jgi:Flp pilus assembly protein TadD